MEKWQSLSSSSSSRKLPLSTEKSASILASNPHKRRSSNEPKKGKAKKKEPLSSAVMENIHSLQTEIIKQIESLPLVDETFREMWDPSVETVAHDQPLFDIVNDIDDEKLLWLEVRRKACVKSEWCRMQYDIGCDNKCCLRMCSTDVRIEAFM